MKITARRCRGRVLGNGQPCCTLEQPCNEGEGDCGEANDEVNTDDLCKGDLVCGRSNCRKIDQGFLQRERCCEKNRGSGKEDIGLQLQQG